MERVHLINSWAVLSLSIEVLLISLIQASSHYEMSNLNSQPSNWRLRLFEIFWSLTVWFACLAFPQISGIANVPDWYRSASELFCQLFLSFLLIWLIYIACFSWFFWIGYPLNRVYKFGLSTISAIALFVFAADKVFWLEFLFEAKSKANAVFQISFYAFYFLGSFLSILLLVPTAFVFIFYWHDYVVWKGNPPK